MAGRVQKLGRDAQWLLLQRLWADQKNMAGQTLGQPVQNGSGANLAWMEWVLPTRLLTKIFLKMDCHV